MDVKQLFNEQKQREIDRMNSSGFKKLADDPRFIHFQPDCTYQLRLIYHLPQGVKRRSPFINKYSHVYFDESSKTYDFVTCPTSEYLDDSNGYRKCKICNHVYTNWLKTKDTNHYHGEMLRQFGRQFAGFAVVFVINDPKKPENNGTLKIIKFSISLKSWFKFYIWGIDETTKKHVDGNPMVIGKDAFDLSAGYNLIITTTTDYFPKKTGERQSYTKLNPAFDMRGLTKLDLTDAWLDEQFKILNFDNDFYSEFDNEATLKFFNSYILPAEVTADKNSIAVQDTPIKTNVSAPPIHVIAQPVIPEPVNPVIQPSRPAGVSAPPIHVIAQPVIPQSVNIIDKSFVGTPIDNIDKSFVGNVGGSPEDIDNVNIDELLNEISGKKI